MPLVRIDMHDHLHESDRAISAAIHRGPIAVWGCPRTTRSRSSPWHHAGDLIYSLTFPKAERTNIVFIDIVLARLYDGPDWYAPAHSFGQGVAHR